MYIYKIQPHNMRVQLIHVIYIVFIFGMVVEANINGRGGVHAEYKRQRWIQHQSNVKILREILNGVHAEYKRRWIHDQLAVKIPHELPTREHRRHTTPHV